MECRGGPVLVLSQGQVVYEEGKLQVQPGTGRFIPRKHFPDLAYQRIKFRNQVQWTDDFQDISSVILEIWLIFIAVPDVFTVHQPFFKMTGRQSLSDIKKY